MDGFLPSDDETVRRLGARQDLLFEDLDTHTPPASRALSWQAQCELYPEVIDRLESAEGPDPDLDRDIALLLEEPPGRRFTADLDDVEAWLRKRHPKGGWSVQQKPHIDAMVWADAPSRRESEFISSAWRDGPRFHMKHPPANAAIALTLAELRGLNDYF